MLDREGQSEERGEGLPTPLRPASPVDIVARRLNKLTASDKEDALPPPNSAERPSTSYGSARSREVVLFMQASELERLGKVSQGRKVLTCETPVHDVLTHGIAIKYYEKAFRLNPDVHRLAQDEGLGEGEDEGRGENLRPAGSLPLPPPSSPPPVSGEETPSVVVRPPPVRPKFQPVIPGALEEISATLDPSMQGPPLGVPDEVLVRILQWVGLLHAASLETCALTCKAMYIASRRSIVWRTLYRSTRATRQSTDWRRRCASGATGRENHPSLGLRSRTQDILIPSIYDHPSPDYRQVYFETPRVRTDGLYICRLSYFRPGLTDGAFCQPVHLVTYYRYLRFFPATSTGHVVLFVVSTEEPKAMIDLLRHPPERRLSDLIPQGVQAMDLIREGAGWPFRAKPGKLGPFTKPAAFRKANLFIGKYFRESPRAPSYSLVLYDPQTSLSPGYIFALDLTVSKSAQSAVSNVIVCDRYCSLSPPITLHGSPRVHDFAVRDWGKFLFSRVRSYIS